VYVCILALVVWYANAFFPASHCILICGLSGYSIVFHIISQKALFLKKKIIDHKMYVMVFSTNYV